MTVDQILQYLGDVGGALGTPCPTDQITGIFCILVKIINYLLAAGGAVAFIFLVVGGLQYMVSGGDEKAISSAKATITYAVLGLVVILSAILIITFVTRDILGGSSA